MNRLIYIFSFILISLPAISSAGSFTDAMETSASGMRAQSERIKVITENIANSETTGLAPGSAPYQRKTIFFKNVKSKESKANIVKVNRIRRDTSTPKLVYQPNHPAANIEGYVSYPNVDTNLENIDIREAQRSYEANVTAIEVTKQMMDRSLDLLR